MRSRGTTHSLTKKVNMNTNILDGQQIYSRAQEAAMRTSYGRSDAFVRSEAAKWWMCTFFYSPDPQGMAVPATIRMWVWFSARLTKYILCWLAGCKMRFCSRRNNNWWWFMCWTLNSFKCDPALNTAWTNFLRLRFYAVKRGRDIEYPRS